MNLCGLSEEYLADVHKFSSYDSSIPYLHRLIGKLISENNYNKATEIIKENNILFNNDYDYLILDWAVEHCIDEVVTLDGKEIKGFEIYKNLKCIKPTKKCYNFIKWLLENGANPNIPEDYNQVEHLEDLIKDVGFYRECEFDCLEIKTLLETYM